MSFLWKIYQVKPNQTGYLYRKNKLQKVLEPGYYFTWDLGNRTELFCLPTSPKMINVLNQEVLTKDNIALRFSFQIIYTIIDGKKFLNNFELNKLMYLLIAEAEQRIHTTAQIHLRNKIVEIESQQLNEKRGELLDLDLQPLNKELTKLGVNIEKIQIRDISFPKVIQELFAKQLDAKIRAKVDLDNARTAVATVRALKNASELMKDDDNIKFFQLLEIITKIASKGRHTFVMGDMQEMVRKLKNQG